METHDGVSQGQQLPVLQLQGIRKSYGHIEALRGVDLTLYPGTIHALMGDNGAGKSTLLKIAAGAEHPDEGTCRIQGQEVDLSSPLDARKLGIETVYQDLALATDRNCVSNVFIGREVRRSGPLGALGFLDRKRMLQRCSEVFSELSIEIRDPRLPVSLLSGGQRQGVALARAALWAESLVLLDEPTAALGLRQREAVRQMLLRLRDRGFGILLISHDVPAVLEVADHITVLRLGEVVGSRPAGEVDSDWVITQMLRGTPAEAGVGR